jgi:hypothetical protein
MQASDCEWALAHPDADGKIEKHLPLLLSQSAVARGLRLAFERARLDARVFDGSAAIDLALAAPDTARRWTRGEPVFSAARISDCTVDASVGSSKNRRKARRRARRR